MYVPYDEKLSITPQDDSFLDREPWDLRNTPPEHFPPAVVLPPAQHLPKASDQTGGCDLGHVPFGRCVLPGGKETQFRLLRSVDHRRFCPLSSCVEAIIAAQIGDMDRAIRYGMAALLMDLADVGGNVKDGCHIASMGGTWMMLAYGFGGMRDFDGALSFWPRRAPEDNASTSVSRHIPRPNAGNRNWS